VSVASNLDRTHRRIALPNLVTHLSQSHSHTTLCAL